jgi:hypothetical protein
MSRKVYVPFLVSLVAALGMFAAMLTTAPPASAWSIVDLPPGFTATHIVIADGSPCPSGYVIFGPGFIRTDADGSGLLCENSPTFQADLDAWVDAHYTAPVTTTAPPPADATTTAPITTTDTSTTVTTPTATTPAPTPAEPAPAAPTVTVTTPGQTITVIATDPNLEARVSALEQRQTVDEARTAVLEANTGIIQGESKSEAPFNRPA